MTRFRQFLFFLLLPLFGFTGHRDYEVIKDRTEIELLTPALAKQKRLKIRLANGLEALLISDPDTPESAASLSVDVGSWDDPDAYPGMAHFCEHMLFMGTKEYPDQDEYMRFISDHSGAPNAFTSTTSTVYTYSIENDAFEGALHRFSRFFVDPLFVQNTVEGELNNVDHEFELSKEHDGWRQFMVFKEMSNPDHPISQFSCGNSETLRHIPRKALVDWYESHYSAEGMHLVAISPLPMDKLIDQVVKGFSDVPRRQKAKKDFPSELTSSKQRGAITYINPVQEISQLELSWELPSSLSTLESAKTAILIGHALGHEGKNSLAHALKSEGLANEFCVGQERIAPNKLMLSITIDLTPNGLQKHQELLGRVYQAINGLKESGIPPEIFEQQKALSVLNMQFQERRASYDLVTAYAAALVNEPIETFPEEGRILSTYQPGLIDELLENMTPSRALITLIARSEEVGVPMTNKERWMGVEYSCSTIEKNQLFSWAHLRPDAAIGLPSLNPYIPQDLKAKHYPVHTTPLVLHNNHQGKFYYQADEYYGVPRTTFIFEIKSPLLNGTPRQTALIKMYHALLDESLANEKFHASQAGLSFAFNSGTSKEQIIVSGYSDKARKLALDLFNTKPNFTQTQFEKQKFNQLIDLRNLSKRVPYAQALTTLDVSLSSNGCSPKALIDATKALSFEEFKQFASALHQKCYIKGFFYGNLSEDDAKSFMHTLLETLGATPYAPEMHVQDTVLVMDKRDGPFSITKRTPMQGNGVVLAVDQGSRSYANEAAQFVLSKALGNSFFNTLRSKQQTGYVARSNNIEREERLFQIFFVQSATHTGEDLLARFNLFLEEYVSQVKEELTPERIEEIKSSLINQLKQPGENMASRANELFSYAFKRHGDFDIINKRIAALEALTPEELYTFAQTTLSRENPSRLAILVLGELPDTHSYVYKEIDEKDLPSVGSYYVTAKEELVEEK